MPNNSISRNFCQSFTSATGQVIQFHTIFVDRLGQSSAVETGFCSILGNFRQFSISATTGQIQFFVKSSACQFDTISSIFWTTYSKIHFFEIICLPITFDQFLLVFRLHQKIHNFRSELVESRDFIFT